MSNLEKKIFDILVGNGITTERELIASKAYTEIQEAIDKARKEQEDYDKDIAFKTVLQMKKEIEDKARAEGYKDGRLSAFKEVKQLAEVKL